MSPEANSPPSFLTEDALQEALNAALIDAGDHRQVARIVRREPSIYSSTFPSEIIYCQFVNGEAGRIFSKYQIGDLPDEEHGHHGGILHEGRVYRDILSHVRVSTPRFLGTHQDPRTGWAGLFLEYLEDGEHLNKVEVQDGLLAAARWLGRFHAENEMRVAANVVSFLPRFDAEYYNGWITRTRERTPALQEQFPWLLSVLDGFQDLMMILLSEPLTIIHSEFYPRNVLVSGGQIWPVDWESTAIAAGEIDLASLTECWGAQLEQECEVVYSQARWGERAPDDFSLRAKIARAYQEFRWLGWIHDSERSPLRVVRLGELAIELGLA